VRELLVDVDVIGVPAAQPRPRACVVAGRARMYDPGTAGAWRQLVRQALASHATRDREEAAVAVDLAVRIPRAKAHYSTKPLSLRPSAPSAHIIKPDIDNLAKAILDETGVIIKDDKQIVALTVTKRYIEPGEKGGARIRIWTQPQL